MDISLTDKQNSVKENSKNKIYSCYVEFSSNLNDFSKTVNKNMSGKTLVKLEGIRLVFQCKKQRRLLKLPRSK